MSSPRRLLPSLERADRSPPPLEEARARLGGRVKSQPGVGRLVALVDGPPASRHGVVIFVEEDGGLHVWLGGGRAARVPPERVEAASEEAVEPELISIAARVCSFQALAEGDRVRVHGPAGMRSGVLVEQHRFGALVEVEGKLLAVAFGRLEPED